MELRQMCPLEIMDALTSTFFDYVKTTYILGRAFPPPMWAAVPSETPKTTNGAEGFHSNYNRQFLAAHPSVNSAINLLRELQGKMYVKINTARNGVPGKRNAKCLMKVEVAQELWAQVMSGKMYLFDYLVRMSYNYDTFSDVAKSM